MRQVTLLLLRCRQEGGRALPGTGCPVPPVVRLVPARQPRWPPAGRLGPQSANVKPRPAAQLRCSLIDAE